MRAVVYIDTHTFVTKYNSIIYVCISKNFHLFFFFYIFFLHVHVHMYQYCAATAARQVPTSVSHAPQHVSVECRGHLTRYGTHQTPPGIPMSARLCGGEGRDI